MYLSGRQSPTLTNLLPEDGSVFYYGQLFSSEKASHYLNLLMQRIPWKQDEVIMFGKKIQTKRKTAWYGDRNFSYTYSNTTKEAQAWNRELLELKQMVEQVSKASYNSCLLNLYASGEEGMGWHSDDEKPLGESPLIASLSLGAARKFSFKHKMTKEKTSVLLENGSLLVMKGETQKNWWHSLPKTKKVSEPRINLTFRTMRE